MPHGEYAQCPQCGKVAFGHDEIETEFGYRYNGTAPQSWCRTCRSSKSNDNSGEGLDAWDAALIWGSLGADEDYTFGYSEEELKDKL